MKHVLRLMTCIFLSVSLCTYTQNSTNQEQQKLNEGLLEAAGAGKLTAVKNFLKQGANPNEHDAEGFTPLMLAASKDSVKIVKVLLSAPATDPNLVNKRGLTALMLAALYDNTKSIEALLASEKTDINQIRRSTGDTALTLALAEEKFDAALVLAKAGADITIKNKQGQAAYDILLKKDTSQESKKLLEYLTPLHNFSALSDKEKTTYLLNESEPIKVRQKVLAWFLNKALRQKNPINPDLNWLIKFYTTYSKHVDYDKIWKELTEKLDKKKLDELKNFANFSQQIELTEFNLGINYLHF